MKVSGSDNSAFVELYVIQIVAFPLACTQREEVLVAVRLREHRATAFGGWRRLSARTSQEAVKFMTTSTTEDRKSI